MNKHNNKNQFKTVSSEIKAVVFPSPLLPTIYFLDFPRCTIFLVNVNVNEKVSHCSVLLGFGI